MRLADAERFLKMEVELSFTFTCTVLSRNFLTYLPVVNLLLHFALSLVHGVPGLVVLVELGLLLLPHGHLVFGLAAKLLGPFFGIAGLEKMRININSVVTEMKI